MVARGTGFSGPWRPPRDSTRALTCPASPADAAGVAGRVLPGRQTPGTPPAFGRQHVHVAATLVVAAARIRTLLHTFVAQYVRATKAHRVVLVTGHGGNRGVLAALVHELRHTHDISVCALHPLALAHLPAGDRPEIHAGLHETALMLHLAPQRLRKRLDPRRREVPREESRLPIRDREPCGARCYRRVR
ncbi:creatininase family protein [Streptomyces sp. NPDC060334]|uniref:creatininase family protein n=1 Tax=Streptomyces sp. NPDC060334 TaxID=3347099 RepID=UPI00365308AA